MNNINIIQIILIMLHFLKTLTLNTHINTLICHITKKKEPVHMLMFLLKVI